LRECLAGIDEEHSITLHKASKCDHYKGELESIHDKHKNEMQRILDQAQADSEQIQTDLETLTSENKKLEEILTKTNDELSFYKNENLDSMMKKEITIINQSAEMDKISHKNKEISEKYEISENLRKSQKESIEELKRQLHTIENNMSDAAGSSNNQLLIMEGKTKENEELKTQILELTNSLSVATSQNDGYAKEIERLKEFNTESVKTKESSDIIIEENKLRVEELQEMIAQIEQSNKELTISNVKQQDLLTLSEIKIEEVEEEMKDLVKSLVALEASKDDESAEFQSHIDKLVNEIQEKETTCNNLKDENFSLQSTLQIEKIKCHNLEGKIAQIESDSVLKGLGSAEGLVEGEEKDEGNREVKGKGESEGDEVSSLRSQLDAAQQIIDQYNAVDNQRCSLLEEIEGLKVSKKELEEHLTELETQLSTVVVTALSNEAAAKTEIETHLYETFRLASEVQGLQVVVEQQTEEIVYLQSQSTSESPRSTRGSFTSNKYLSNDDVILEVRPELAVLNGLKASDEMFTDIDIENINKHDIIIEPTADSDILNSGTGQGQIDNIGVQVLNQQIQDQNQQIQDQNQRIQSLSEQAQEMSHLLETKSAELLHVTAALTASEAELSTLIKHTEAQRLEYLEKDDLISQVVDGKKALEEEIKRFLGE
jgi:chromosome segregation ATPase